MTARFNLISSSCTGLLAVGRKEVGGTSTVVLTLKRICAVTMCVCVALVSSDEIQLIYLMFLDVSVTKRCLFWRHRFG